MLLDRTRLQPSVTELAAARAAYAAALRERAAPSTLEAARARVERARRLVDAARRDQLLVFSTSRMLLGSIPGDHVLSLFPVGVEAKLDAGRRLRVRVWPDSISTSTHDPRLTATEADAGRRYWVADGAATTDEGHRGAWRELADVVGIARGAWVARVLTPINQALLAPGIEPLFPTVAMFDEAAPFVPRAGVLPDRWIVTGFRDGIQVFDHAGAPIPHDLAAGLDTTPSETSALRNQEGEPIQLPPRMRWLTDFDAARECGMAMEIPLAATIDHLDLLLVYGARITESPADSAHALAEVLTGHRYSRGLAFVAQDTPTNNSAEGGAGMPSRDERMKAAFDLERRPREFPNGLTANGTAAAAAFGLDSDVFAPLSGSGATSKLESEPDGFEPEVARAMQTVLWQATLGATVEDLLGLGAARSDILRDHYREHVRAAGPVPAIRVGRQPYGVLPVTLLDEFVAAPSDAIDAGLIPLLKAARTWMAMLRQGELYAGTTEEALRHLGRSEHLFAEVTTQAGGAGNRWEHLASTLFRLSRGAILPTWRTRPITNMREAPTRRVTRSTVDDTTAADLASFARAEPSALLASALPSSVLARMARHAALLEWGRFARAVCNVALDPVPRQLLASNAARNGIAVYLNTVVNALNGDPAGNEEQQRIAALVGNLRRPDAAAPGAPRLASFRRSLTTLSQIPKEQLESAMYGTLDVCNHRFDAWVTSLASRRLASLRATEPRGVVIGGWGCLQDVRPANQQEQSAEFIHTPSLDHAAAAAVLRSAARRAAAAESQHADVDLSSRRVRLARWILEGIRNGRSLSEMLGIRFERALKRTPGGEMHLATLRSSFSVKNRGRALDGLDPLEATFTDASDPAVAAAAKTLKETMDAVADALTAESVYQLVKGSGAGALLDLDAISHGQIPPPLRVLETPAAGTRLTHRLVIAVPRDAKAPGWPANPTPRAVAEPMLDAWCGLVLGPPMRILLTVEGNDGLTTAVPLATLGIAAIDVMAAGRDGGSELAERVVLAARQMNPAAVLGGAVRRDRTWKDLVGLCAVMAQTVAPAQPLRADALEAPDALTTASAEDFGDLPARGLEAAERLSAVREQLVARLDPAGAVRAAAAFGVSIPDVLLATAPRDQDLDALRSAVDARLAAAAAASTPRERLRILFGGDLPGLVPFSPRTPAAFATTTSPPPESLLAGDSLAPVAWLDATGRTRPAAARLAEILLRVEVAGNASAQQLRIVQAPWADGDRWIATSFEGRSGRRPDGRLSVVIHAPAGLDPTAAMGGLLLDAWVESVPYEKRDTAMALHYNSPSSRAPQAILLAVSPDPTRAWTPETLVAILRQTLEMTRMRMLPPTLYSRSGHLPQVWLGRRPANRISFTL